MIQAWEQGDLHAAGAVRGLVPNAARLTQFFRHQTLRLSAYASYNAGTGDHFMNPELRYSFTDKIWGAIGANVFGGKPWGQFGQLSRDDNVYLQIRYNF